MYKNIRLWRRCIWYVVVRTRLKEGFGLGSGSGSRSGSGSGNVRSGKSGVWISAR